MIRRHLTQREDIDDMKNWNHLAVLVVLLLLTACSQPSSYVVLMEDLDGSTGAISVSNDKGQRSLDKTGYAIGIDDPAAPPSEPFVVSEETVNKTFGAAMALTPEPPITFLLYFTPGTSELTKESAEKLKQVLPAVTARKYPTISVTGHTDRVGQEQFNAELAYKRAMEIRDLLVREGIAQTTIEVRSHGENNPLIPTEDEIDEPRNRRVEVIVR